MGGTSFDVGIVYEGRPQYSFVSNVAQYEYFLPKVDIQAIGSGGGSLARLDSGTRTLQVGPESAGADPGPACYGKGNETPTVTDADVVLGYLNPENFLGGRINRITSYNVCYTKLLRTTTGPGSPAILTMPLTRSRSEPSYNFV